MEYLEKTFKKIKKILKKGLQFVSLMCIIKNVEPKETGKQNLLLNIYL